MDNNNQPTTVKRDFLRKIETELQKEWAESALFEENATEGSEKYLVTFPYPYMNGRLHLGHTFTLMKGEFMANYQRLKGKKVLFPFGFHGTGMPIKACADKLKREIEEFGNPPVFPASEQANQNEGTPQPNEKSQVTFHSQKSKAKAKSAGPNYQWNIMKANGVSQDEIVKFSDAHYWLSYFPTQAQADLQKIGISIDWRRAFITTDVNPFYDSFIRWQFETLRNKGKIQFGKRFTIFSPKDGQPCADHDRQIGENVLPQEYTIIKLEIMKPFPGKLKSLENKSVFLVPATLRPETMYGQTNCWVLPDGDYGAFEISDSEVFICTARSARNLAFQNYSKEFGKVNCLLELKGWDILGLPLRAPLSFYPIIYSLPMTTIALNKGTGIVASVPSDAPDDYINLEELKKKQSLRSKFNIRDEMVIPFEMIPIINVPDMGDKSAMFACQKFKVKSPNDRELLSQAKDSVYLNSFNKGVMLVGKYKGSLVKDVKNLIKDELIANSEAIIYSEPADLVVSRSNDECVVCLTDQWFLDYGEASWKAQIDNHLKNMETYNEDARKKFEIAIQWLSQWACSRTYGLGTRLPWDEQYLIESLSDSTIYMAYYTVSHLLQGGVIDGSSTGPAQISPEQLTHDVWNYIFLKRPYPENCSIPESTLQKLRAEFEFWYPVDLRVSGKDLINNHLIFFLYNHAAIWPDMSKWPRSMQVNGLVLLNNEKMSKSLGNFLTLSDAIEQFSADATRFTLADSGDSLEDANFSTSTADTAILRLYNQIDWIQELLATKEKLRAGPPTTFFDRLFVSQIAKSIKETDLHYSKMRFKDALRTGFFDLQSYRDAYRQYTSAEGMNFELLFHFIEVQALLLAPITPHWSEYVWKLLGRKGSIRRALWPISLDLDDILLKQNEYLQGLLHSLRLKKEQFRKKNGGKPGCDPKSLNIYVAQDFPDWMKRTVNIARKYYESDKSSIMSENIIKEITGDTHLKTVLNKVMPFFAQLKEQIASCGLAAFNLKVAFDEKKLLEDHLVNLLKSSLEIEVVNVLSAQDDVIQKCLPEKPYTTFQ